MKHILSVVVLALILAPMGAVAYVLARIGGLDVDSSVAIALAAALWPFSAYALRLLPASVLEQLRLRTERAFKGEWANSRWFLSLVHGLATAAGLDPMVGHRLRRSASESDSGDRARSE